MSLKFEAFKGAVISAVVAGGCYTLQYLQSDVGRWDALLFDKAYGVVVRPVPLSFFKWPVNIFVVLADLSLVTSNLIAIFFLSAVVGLVIPCLGYAIRRYCRTNKSKSAIYGGVIGATVAALLIGNHSVSAKWDRNRSAQKPVQRATWLTAPVTLGVVVGSGIVGTFVGAAFSHREKTPGP